MTQYCKKRIPVNAIQWHKAGDHAAVVLNESGCPAIKTAEGWLSVVQGCWIVGPGAAGEYWPVQDAIFRATYEEVK
jgi:hypothetical protein